MNTLLSQYLNLWAKEEPDELIKNRLRFVAVRVSQMEMELDQATRHTTTRETTTRETLRMHLVKSLEMLGPKDTN